MASRKAEREAPIMSGCFLRREGLEMRGAAMKKTDKAPLREEGG